ncbi:hypothetical protein YC2023_094046 [Brassica napus]
MKNIIEFLIRTNCPPILVDDVGKLVKPEESSATYVSFVGCTDRRVEIDKNISVGTIEYKSMLSIMASKVSYENKSFITSVVENTWKSDYIYPVMQMDFVSYYDFYNGNLLIYLKESSANLLLKRIFMHVKVENFQKPDASLRVQGIEYNPNLIVVSFRGTEPFDVDDWCTDLDISWYELKNVGKVHAGFSKALGLQKNGWPKEIIPLGHQYAYYTIRQKLRDMFAKNKNLKFILTGHSLGGALAALFPAVLAIHGEDELLDKLEGVYTFGQPRIGDEVFGEFMKEVVRKHGIEYERFVYNNDIVPRIPFDDKVLFSFKHYGSCNYFNSLYKGKVREDAPNENYFNLLWLIPKLLNGAWEFIRSFIIRFWKGKDYKENWIMRSIRVFGIIFPGASNHLPYDYVNSTRLGGLSRSFAATTPEDILALIA